MDIQSTENAIIIEPDFSKTFEWSDDLRTITIKPLDTLTDLRYSTTYTVTILETAKDTLGNQMDTTCAPYTFSFTTKEPEFELSVVPSEAKEGT